MATITNTTLIEAAQRGDAHAIEHLLRDYQPMLERFARRYCATPEDVEDAVQETLWIAAQKIGTLRVAAAFGSWAFQVVRHHCYRLLRRGERETPLIEEDALHLVAGHDEAQFQLQHDIAEALAALPYDYRMVVVLSDIEEWTAPEAAARLNISVAAVKARLHRARKLLRHSLAQWHTA